MFIFAFLGDLGPKKHLKKNPLHFQSTTTSSWTFNRCAVEMWALVIHFKFKQIQNNKSKLKKVVGESKFDWSSNYNLCCLYTAFIFLFVNPSLVGGGVKWSPPIFRALLLHNETSDGSQLAVHLVTYIPSVS